MTSMRHRRHVNSLRRAIVYVLTGDLTYCATFGNPFDTGYVAEQPLDIVKICCHTCELPATFTVDTGMDDLFTCPRGHVTAI